MDAGKLYMHLYSSLLLGVIILLINYFLKLVYDLNNILASQGRLCFKFLAACYISDSAASIT